MSPEIEPTAVWVIGIPAQVRTGPPSWVHNLDLTNQLLHHSTCLADMTTPVGGTETGNAGGQPRPAVSVIRGVTDPAHLDTMTVTGIPSGQGGMMTMTRIGKIGIGGLTGMTGMTGIGVTGILTGIATGRGTGRTAAETRARKSKYIALVLILRHQLIITCSPQACQSARDLHRARSAQGSAQG